MTEQAREVYDQIKPEEPPPNDPPTGGDDGHDHNPERREFSGAAVAISLVFMAGGVYLFAIGFRAIRLELARLKGGKK